MGFESLLLIVVVVEAVWILSSLFRGSDDDRKALQRRPPRRDGDSPNPRPRQPVTNVDRFLEEINRRRREAAERQAGTTRTEAPAQSRPRPSPPRPDRPPQRRPSAVPVVVTAAEAPPAVVVRPPQVEVVRDKRRPQTEVLEVELEKPAVATTPAVAVIAAQVFVPPAPSSVQPARRVTTSSTQTQTHRASPVLEQLLPLLRDRRSLPVALALNEILGPPLSRRSPASRRRIV